MKLKTYTNMLLSQINDEVEEIQQITFNSILSKLLALTNSKGTELTMYPSYKTPLNELKTILPIKSPEIITIMKCMGLGDGDYLKYYLLDKLTNTRYIDHLISHIYSMYTTKGTVFIYNFSLNNFFNPGPNPSIYVEYREEKGNKIGVPTVYYLNPFHGDMELEDFLSMAITDPMFLLSPYKCTTYLMEKIINNVTIIPYSINKYINLIPMPRGRYQKKLSEELLGLDSYELPISDLEDVLLIDKDTIYFVNSSVKTGIVAPHIIEQVNK